MICSRQFSGMKNGGVFEDLHRLRFAKGCVDAYSGSEPSFSSAEMLEAHGGGDSGSCSRDMYEMITSRSSGGRSMRRVAGLAGPCRLVVMITMSVKPEMPYVQDAKSWRDAMKRFNNFNCKLKAGFDSAPIGPLSHHPSYHPLHFSTSSSTFSTHSP